MTVYVVEAQGCEFGMTAGVFSTAEAAREFAKAEDDRERAGGVRVVDYYQIFEWELDGPVVRAAG